MPKLFRISIVFDQKGNKNEYDAKQSEEHVSCRIVHQVNS